MQKIIFLTGATGQLGRQIISKMIKDSNTRFILLIRGNVYERLAQLITHCFDSQEEIIAAYDRISVVRGDITQPDCGLSQRDCQMIIRSATHIIHSAANVKFNISLDAARKTNLEGARNVLELGYKSYRKGNLQVFGHISTAYVCGLREGIIYENDLDAGQSFANSYEQSKFQTEQLVRAYMNKMPISVFRPSIVVGNSHTGKTAAFNVLYIPIRMICEGRLSCLSGWHDVPADVVPVDFIADALQQILLADKVYPGMTFHLTNGLQNGLTCGNVIDLAIQYFRENGIMEPGCEFRFIGPDQFERQIHAPDPLMLNVINTFEPYISFRHYFDDANTRSVLDATDIKVPDLHEYMPALLQYSIHKQWGKVA